MKTQAENCGWIVPPMIEARITGVQYAKCFASGKVTLTYEDGQEETATLTQKQINDARDNFFSLVGSVQSYRKSN